MGNIKNRAKKNQRLARNWRKIIKTRKSKKLISTTPVDYRIFKNDNFKVNDSQSGNSQENQKDYEMQCETNDLNFDDIIEEDYDGSSCYDETIESVNESSENQKDQLRFDNSTMEWNVDDFIEEDYGDNYVPSFIETVENCYEVSNVNENSQQGNEDEICNDIDMQYPVCSQSEFENHYENGNEMQSESGNQDDIDMQNESENHEDSGESELENHYENGNEMQSESGNQDDIDKQNEFENHDSGIRNLANEFTLNGRRIVDIRFFVDQMRNVFEHHARECTSNMELMKETKMGLKSIFYFHCEHCGESRKIVSCVKYEDCMHVNKAATLGVTSIGSGFYHMQEVFAHLEIPCMSSTTFDVENKKLQTDWWKLAKLHQEQALLKEIELAIARGDVDSAGNALIKVIVDGSWGKRSYGKGYSSLSGCAAIVGFHTKKIIYFDVKNKYCDICTKSYAKNNPPNKHECNINYEGPSSGMETEILVEGFQHCELLGARFHKIVSDGDSSAFKEISERCIYQNPEIVIEKVECINHLIKNFNKKVSSLHKHTKFKSKDRKVMKESIGEEISKGVRCAAKHWRESNVSRIEKLKNLEKDCLNAPYHYFGNHDKCNRYFCKKTTTVEGSKTIELLKSSGLFHEVLNYCNIYFASNVNSLLEDCTNNWAEEFNNIVAKYLGGKRINYSLAGSYKARVAAAVTQYNTKGHAGSEMHKLITEKPNTFCLNMENSRRKHYDKNEIARQAKPRKKATKDKITKDYGASSQRPDMTESAFEIAKNIVLAELDVNRINRDLILADTFGQKHSLRWLEVQKKLIDSSYFSRIINARSPKSYEKMLDEMLYSRSGNTAEVRHQRIYEEEALKMFSLLHKDYELEETGFFIDKELSFLGASPLRLYGPDSIVNIFCPVKSFRKTFDEAMSMKKKELPFKRKDGELHLNIKSNIYVEAQGQLHITGRSFAYWVFWLGTEFTVRKIKVDHSFWRNQMEKKLEFFFYEAMIKELANSRRGRKMELRKYDSRTNSFI